MFNSRVVAYLIVFVAVPCTLARLPAGQGNDREGKQSNRASGTQELRMMLEVKVRAAWESFKQKDKKAYSESLTDDFVAVEADNEGTRDKQHAVREVERSVINSYNLTNFTVTRLGTDAALTTYEAFIQFPPTAQARYQKVYVGEVWVKRDGQWKTLHHQETRVK